jgi:hypothetical protein
VGACGAAGQLRRVDLAAESLAGGRGASKL